MPSNQNQAAESVVSEKNKKEKDEREAMEVGMGNIVLNSDSKPIKDSPSPSSSNPSKGAASSSSR